MLRPSLENPTDLGKEVSDPVGSPPNFKAVLDTYFSEKKRGCHENIAHSFPFFFTCHPASFLFLLFVFFFLVSDGSVDHRVILQTYHSDFSLRWQVRTDILYPATLLSIDMWSKYRCEHVFKYVL